MSLRHTLAVLDTAADTLPSRAQSLNGILRELQLNVVDNATPEGRKQDLHVDMVVLK